MGSVHAKPSSTTSRSYSKRQSSSLVSVIRGIMLALAASAVPFLIICTLPSLNLFLFEVIPSLWKCSCELFTPRNLFVLLNLIILSIFVMAHLHSGQAAAASSSLQSPACDDHAPETSEDTVSRSVSEEIKLDDKKSADLQLVDVVQSSNQQINDIHDQLTDHDAHNDDDPDNQAINTGLLVIKGVIIETHLQQADDNYRQHFADHPIVKRKATPESKKAEKAQEQCADREAESKKTEKARIGQEAGVIHCADQAINEKLAAQAKSKKAEKAMSTSSLQGNPLAFNIDSLLSEESSIFTRAESRPLPSARFTHKKANKLSGLDRPLSPLKMSRPILKRGDTRGDTIEDTWKAICENKRHSSPLNRHHSKHTIKRRESSLPQEELNAKVESFISRFNEQIRIQREKSLLDYMEMVGRGAN